MIDASDEFDANGPILEIGIGVKHLHRRHPPSPFGDQAESRLPSSELDRRDLLLAVATE